MGECKAKRPKVPRCIDLPPKTRAVLLPLCNNSIVALSIKKRLDVLYVCVLTHVCSIKYLRLSVERVGVAAFYAMPMCTWYVYKLWNCVIPSSTQFPRRNNIYLQLPTYVTCAPSCALSCIQTAHWTKKQGTKVLIKLNSFTRWPSIPFGVHMTLFLDPL